MGEFRKHNTYSNSNISFNMMNGIEHYYSNINLGNILYQLKFNYLKFGISILKTEKNEFI